MTHFEYGGKNIESPGKLESIKVKITCDKQLTSPDAVGQLSVLLGLGDSSVRKAFPEITNMQPDDKVMFVEPVDRKSKRYFDTVGTKSDGSKLFHIRIVLHLKGFDVLRPN
jgi:hypothetical protein